MLCENCIVKKEEIIHWLNHGEWKDVSPIFLMKNIIELDSTIIFQPNCLTNFFFKLLLPSCTLKIFSELRNDFDNYENM